MLTGEINYLALIGAAVIHSVIGTLWYSPILFGNLWMKLSGVTKEQMEKGKAGMFKKYIASFATALLMAYVLLYLIQITSISTVLGAVRTGFWLWLGFIATSSFAAVLWSGKAFKLYLLDVGFYLAAISAMIAVLAGWR